MTLTGRVEGFQFCVDWQLEVVAGARSGDAKTGDIDAARHGASFERADAPSQQGSTNRLRRMTESAC